MQLSVQKIPWSLDAPRDFLYQEAVCACFYFSRIKILIGVPDRSQFSRILFSKKRL